MIAQTKWHATLWLSFKENTMRSYLQFALSNRRFVGFGFLMALSSSFGQTYFIAVFGPEIQREFSLSHTEWGLVYMLGTMASAVVLPITGKLIDEIALQRYTTAVVLALAGACVFVALVPSVWILIVAIFLLRQTGQGLSSHISSTSMARYFDSARGRAIAVSALGFAVGEACLPFIATQAIGMFGWRLSYVLVAVAQAGLMLPILLWLLRGHEQRHQAYLQRVQRRSASATGDTFGWTRGQVIRDQRFYLMLPGLMAPSLVLTGLFFHHLNVADAKQWSHSWMTGSYIIYALATVTTSLISGHLVDRLGAIRVVPAMLGPMCAGMALLALGDNLWLVWPYMVLIGVSSGVTYTALSAMWAELYGTVHIGAIKSLAIALGVLASGLGPVCIGVMLDGGLGIDAILWSGVMYGLLSALLLRLALATR